MFYQTIETSINSCQYDQSIVVVLYISWNNYISIIFHTFLRHFQWKYTVGNQVGDISNTGSNNCSDWKRDLTAASVVTNDNYRILINAKMLCNGSMNREELWSEKNEETNVGYTGHTRPSKAVLAKTPVYWID